MSMEPQSGCVGGGSHVLRYCCYYLMLLFITIIIIIIIIIVVDVQVQEAGLCGDRLEAEIRRGMHSPGGAAGQLIGKFCSPP